MREFTTGAYRDDDEGKIHYKGFISATAMRAFGEYMERKRYMADGTTRAPDNWKKGVPAEVYEDSLMRHTMDLLRYVEQGAHRTSPHVVDTACAVLFNIQGWLHTVYATEAVEEPERLVPRHNENPYGRVTAKPAYPYEEDEW